MDEIQLFLLEYNNADFIELVDIEWLTKLMFFTDLALHLNTLNKKLQTRGKRIEIWTEIKLDIFVIDINLANLTTSQNRKKFWVKVQI